MYDLRGHGRSDRPSTGYRLESFVDDLVGLLDALGETRRVHVVGNSFGGTIAAGLAAWYPDRVATVTMIESEPPVADVGRAHGGRSRRRQVPAGAGGGHRLDRRQPRHAHREALPRREPHPGVDHAGRGRPGGPGHRRRPQRDHLPDAGDLRRRVRALAPRCPNWRPSWRTAVPWCCPSRATPCWWSAPRRPGRSSCEWIAGARPRRGGAVTRFLLVVPPLVGHINPLIGVADELARRGHEVAWAGLRRPDPPARRSRSRRCSPATCRKAASTAAHADRSRRLPVPLGGVLRPAGRPDGAGPGRRDRRVPARRRGVPTSTPSRARWSRSGAASCTSPRPARRPN